MPGSLEVIAGSMFSGKTVRLIARLRDAESQGLRVRAYKPRVDNRYAVDAIVSHTGTRFPASVFEQGVPQTADVVGIDEVQFLPESVVDLVLQWVKQGARVIVSGLDLDCWGKPFGPMPTLLSYATEVQKLTAICAQCGGEASRSQRLATTESTIFVGGAEAYEPRCFSCFEPAKVVENAVLLANL
jgi:thymidine kinase